MKIVEILEKHGDLELDAPLSKHTTYRIGGRAKYLVYPKNELSLIRIIETCKDEGLPFKVFGKGSNILCSDAYFHGVVICLDRYFNEFNFEEDGTCVAQAGVSLILLANNAMKESFSGLEFASGIPATIGGAVAMNAGAYKSDMSSIINRVYVLKDSECVWLSKEQLDFSYRHSIFHNHPDWIILGIELKLVQGDQKEIRDLIDARRQRRQDSQPLEKPNAGSVFRNPKDVQAWQLIEGCGLRGKQIGGAKISEKHANFIVNEGNATAEDIDQLVLLVQNTVFEKYGVHLKMEVEKFNWEDSKTKIAN
ncbi:UDP-N-acetylmuramate dehydrogenase [Breznakia sp. PF5-3]|uniref:UDP-N-acetylmuramate dehydrogenase n=1 Tax=unclassified Breznakia TaxID=2623764 RepID=UPI0024066084|nr:MULTISPECIES: UDP-N-acetylmuramate dehydrogenase [unclassified Breznakia]MDL2276455.1 UDP-N-acetylmuramate dehydrogenase [Breznakia sp. OttesenSCG-928-G09]MDF9825019.1 UDP-N-acetylmuramate dehydrogenase [Breznakia sp. PM6-1]MDF9835410.1 UDP-N-acetylmuramate dehydrogenase [Breznakia sp. PF5-3]MDF9837642.1 UDP-N-acetylmuramate dehydrogenase [Breznakia sp. PFB2-8]MDF9859506.1 UDP-N-acetylmuramate dehydrogenase [Breznakia sp. PH5-24]